MGQYNLTMPRKIEISHRTIIFTVIFIAGLWFVFFIRDILMQVFVALLITIVLNPVVTRLEKRRVPRALSVLIVYFSVLSLVIFMVANIVPLLVDQTTHFAMALPRYLEELSIPNNIVDEMTRQFTGQLGGLPSQLLSISIEVFSNVLTIFSVLIFALYFLMARQQLDSELSKFLPHTTVNRIDKLLNKMEIQLGGWARGQILLMFLIWLVTYVGLLMLGVPYALSLALLAGILEAVPNLGPIIAAIPAVIVGFGVSPITGLAVLALSFLVQQVESYVFVPKVMQKSAGVNPIVTLLALIIGFKVYGVVGAILSVPVAITLKLLAEDYFSHKHNEIAP